MRSNISERGGMVGAGARHLLEEIVVAQRLDQADRDAVLRQRERQAQPDRPGADDDDAIGPVMGCGSAT